MRTTLTMIWNRTFLMIVVLLASTYSQEERQPISFYKHSSIKCKLFVQLGRTSTVVSLQFPTRTILQFFDIHSLDFATTGAFRRENLGLGDLYTLAEHKSNPNLLFTSSNNPVIYDTQTFSIAKSFTGSVVPTLTIEHINSTNFIFSGGAAQVLLKYDLLGLTTPIYTSGDLAYQVNFIYQLRSPGSNELVIGLEDPEIQFYDLTSPGILIRSYTHAETTNKRFLNPRMTPQYLIPTSTLGRALYVLKIDDAVITEHHKVTGLCNAAPLQFTEDIENTAWILGTCYGGGVLTYNTISGLNSKEVLFGVGLYHIIPIRGRRELLIFGRAPLTTDQILAVYLTEKVACSEFCKTCTADPSECLSCRSDKILSSKGTCGPNCPSFEYVKNGVCETCHSSCFHCSGPSKNECIVCPPEHVTSIKKGVCVKCTQETCPRCLKEVCKKCSDLTATPEMDCPELLDVSIFTKKIVDSNFTTIYLLIKISPVLSIQELEIIIDQSFFRIKLLNNENLGEVELNQDKELIVKEEIHNSNSLEQFIRYLIFSRPNHEIKTTQDLHFSISSEKEVLDRDLLTGKATKTFKKISREIEYQIPQPFQIQVISSTVEKYLKSTELHIQKSGVGFLPVLFGIGNLIGFIVKFFQIIELLINISYINTNLGSLIQSVVEVLKKLKFPLSLPQNYFVDSPLKKSERSSWKYRYKFSEHDEPIFILSNETIFFLIYFGFSLYELVYRRNKRKSKTSSTFSSIKMIFFYFVFMDIQFLCINELLHSDPTRFSSVFSSEMMSYLCSFLCLNLVIRDHWIYLNQAISFIHKRQSHTKRTKLDQAVKDILFDQIKLKRDNLQFKFVYYNVFSMLRFSLFQVIIISLQLFPILQNIILTLLQVLFMITLLRSNFSSRIFSSKGAVFVAFTFEICLSLVLFIALVFSFDLESHELAESGFGIVLQIVTVFLVLFCILVEFCALFICLLILTWKKLKKILKILKLKKSRKNLIKIVPCSTERLGEKGKLLQFNNKKGGISPLRPSLFSFNPSKKQLKIARGNSDPNISSFRKIYKSKPGKAARLNKPHSQRIHPIFLDPKISIPNQLSVKNIQTFVKDSNN